MANEIKGQVEYIAPISERKSQDGTKTYIERDIVINARRFDPYTGEPQRDNFISMRMNGERCKELDNIKQGELVCCRYILDGMKYQDKQTQEDKYFTRISCYKVEKVRPDNKVKDVSNVNKQPEPLQHQPFDEPKPANDELPWL